MLQHPIETLERIDLSLTYPSMFLLQEEHNENVEFIKAGLLISKTHPYLAACKTPPLICQESRPTELSQQENSPLAFA